MKCLLCSPGGRTRYLTIKRQDRGILVDATFLAPDGKIVASIKNNFFDVNPNNTLTRRRPDASTLEVIDEFGKQALKMRFMNPLSVGHKSEALTAPA